MTTAGSRGRKAAHGSVERRWAGARLGRAGQGHGGVRAGAQGLGSSVGWLDWWV
jgi:hypothetical protein